MEEKIDPNYIHRRAFALQKADGCRNLVIFNGKFQTILTKSFELY